MFALAPAQNLSIWIEKERSVLAAPMVLEKTRIKGKDGLIVQCGDNEFFDLRQNRDEFAAALEELKNLVFEKTDKLSNHVSSVGKWAIAIKAMPEDKIFQEPWDVKILIGAINKHDDRRADLTDPQSKQVFKVEASKVFVFREESDRQLLENQLQLCKDIAQQFKTFIEKLSPSDESFRPALAIAPNPPEKEAFYFGLGSGKRKWLIEQEQKIGILADKEKQLTEERDREVARRNQEIKGCAAERNEVVRSVKETLTKDEYENWLKFFYQPRYGASTFESAKRRAQIDIQVAKNPDFAALPKEVMTKFQGTAVTELVKSTNTKARKAAIAEALKPEVKEIRYSFAKKLIEEQDDLEPPQDFEESSEEDYPYEAIREAKTNQEIKLLIDSIVHQKVCEALEDEGKKIYWEEKAKEEAKEEVAENLERAERAIAELAKVKSERDALVRKNEELERKIQQLESQDLVAQNQDLQRKVEEYAAKDWAKKQVEVKYHFIENTAQVLFNKGDQLNTFREVLSVLKAKEEELLLLKRGASAKSAAENSQLFQPDGDVSIAELKPQKQATGT